MFNPVSGISRFVAMERFLNQARTKMLNSKRVIFISFLPLVPTCLWHVSRCCCGAQIWRREHTPEWLSIVVPLAKSDLPAPEPV